MKYEIIGLTGTLFILFAFLFNGEKKIRIFDMVGSAFFVTYGLCIGAWSNVILNGLLIIVHIVKLIKMRKSNGKRTEPC